MAKETIEHEFFTWRWKDQPPLKSMLGFAAKNPHLKAFDVNEGSDMFSVIFARNIKEARKHIKNYYDNEGGMNMPKIEALPEELT